MQLDLFCDNRRTIRLNDAGDLLRAPRLEEALAIYDELLLDEPGDPELLELRRQVDDWRARLADFSRGTVTFERLHDLWRALSSPAPPPLTVALRNLLIDRLARLPAPESIYVPPRFHLGAMLLAAGRYAEAECWLARALAGGIEPRARFLAWRGDCLLRLGDAGRAKEAYLAAFLEGPHEVDGGSLQSPPIRELLISLEHEEHELGVAELPAWLPVWGWLQGEFGFRLDDIAAAPPPFGAALEAARQSGSQPLPRLWFGYLRYAEYLRTLAGSHAELGQTRRRMRQINGFMFERYLERIRGRCAAGKERVAR